MKWLGQYVQSLTSRFRSDVYLESISTGTIASGAHLGLDSNNKIVKAVDGGGDLTSIVAGTGLSGTSLTGPIPTINIDAAQPTVTSLGTLTGLTGGTGDFIWNTNTLVVDTSEAKVGIGTTSPSELLHISSGVATHAKVLIDAGADADLILDKGAGSRRSHIDYKIAGTTKWYAGTADSDVVGDGDDYFIGTTVGGSNAEFFLKRSNGYVGIGTNSPSEALEVSGKAIIRKSGSATAHGDTDLLVTDATAASSTAAIQILGGNAGFSNLQFSDTNSYSQGAIMYGHTDNYMAFKANAAEKMRITSAGNLGVGVTAPASKLHVAGTVQVGVDDTGHDVKFFGATANHYMLWDESADLLQVAGDLEIKNANGSNPSDAGSLVFNESGTAWGSNMYGFRLNLEGSSNLLQFQSANTSTVSTILTMGRDNLTSTFSGPLTVGVDDTGHDVKFYGATTGRYLWWDESEDALKLRDNTTLKIGSGSDLQIKHDGSNSYISQNDGGNLYIQQNVNDADIIFQSDDGSGGTTPYLTLDGSAGYTTAQKQIRFADSVEAQFGGIADLTISHDATNSIIANNTGDLQIKNRADDKDIIFETDDGSGGTTAYLTLDGSATRTAVHKNMLFDDSVTLGIGASYDLQLYHNGSHSLISNQTGNLYLRNQAEDGDIIIQADDGSGGDATYMTFDGGIASILTYRDILMANDGNDGNIKLGASQDLVLNHDGTNSIIQNATGDLKIINYADDKDIRFFSDDGSGGVAEYLTLDGSLADGTYTYTTRPDNGVLTLGGSRDLRLWHDGSNSAIQNNTGNLTIKCETNDGDLILKSDDGSGGTTAYLTLDGSTKRVEVDVQMGIATPAVYTANTSADELVVGSGSGVQGMTIYGATGAIYFATDLDEEAAGDDPAGNRHGILKYTPSEFTFKTGGNQSAAVIGNGGSSFTSTLTVGVDDTGHDVRFYGATSGRYMEWDESSDRLEFTDNASLSFGAGADLHLFHDGTDSWVNNANGNLLFVQNADDKDIVFYCDDGSGGVEEYFRLDGSAGGANPVTIFPDNSYIHLGSGQDMVLGHTGSDTYFTNNTGDLYIQNKADDKDIIFQSDDGSGGVETYFFLDGSASSGEPYTVWPDSSIASWGTGSDFRIKHDGSHAYLYNTTGDIKIINYADDKDIVFQSDDGAGGLATYFFLDGSLGSAPYTIFPDSSTLALGTGYDLRLYHDGSNSYMRNTTGNLIIQAATTDGDLILQSDDGSGGETAYLTLDGSASQILIAKETVFGDSILGSFGANRDLRIQHTGSDAYMDNYTGDIYFRQRADDKDIIFKGTDGGADITALTLDMSDAGTAIFNHDIRLTDNGALKVGNGNDLQIFHDASNSYIYHGGTGNLYIKNETNDQDVVLQCDDGSGGVTAYLTLDGSASRTTVQKMMRFEDNVQLTIGDGGDLELSHDGSISSINNYVGNLYIRQQADDKDIIFQSDDGSGGVKSYFYLDGSIGATIVPDSTSLGFGTGGDMYISHNATNTNITNFTGDLYITNKADDKDVILQSDDGSGGVTSYLTLDGSAGCTTAQKKIQFGDSVIASFGASGDFYISHNGSYTSLMEQTSDLYISNNADDKDIIFRCDDGAGGLATYFKLDGSAATHDGSATTGLHTIFPDNSSIGLGTGNDLRLYHQGSYSIIGNNTGDLYIQNNANDKDIIFQSDDGSGGTTAYLTLDGSAGTVEVAKPMNLVDDLTITGGNGGQLTITSGNVAWDAVIDLDTGDSNGQWRIKAEGSDETFHITNVDQGGTSAFSIHPTTKAVTLATPLATDQQKHVMHYDFQGYATGDGTNYEMANNLSDTNAPFEHNISLGEDGVTATTIQNIIRSGGKVMPRACTLTRWTGWAAAAGSQTAYVALFKVTPTRNSNTDLSAVLLDEFSYTALGNAKMEDFDETGFTATAIAAGDILITAMKSQSGAVHYFTSTVEVEF